MNKKIRTPFAAIILIAMIPLLVLNSLHVYHKLIGYNGIFDFDIFMYFLNESFIHNTVFIIELLILLALSIILFAKKRNIVLAIPFACNALLSLVICFINFGIWNFLYFVADTFLFILALSVCEQNIIKIDFSKIKKIPAKLFYLPAIIYLAREIYWDISFLLFNNTITTFFGMFARILEVILLFNIVGWLRNPYAKENDINVHEEKEEQGEAYCGLGKHILLLLFTFGIWNLIWTYRTTKYLNKAPNAQYYNPTSKLLLCIFIPFYSIYWYYRHGQRIDSFSKSKGLNGSDMATLCLILGIFIPIVACILMQDKINTLCTVKLENKEKQKENQHIEELKKFKELLDAGIITQEEFDAKKKQLLGL